MELRGASALVTGARGGLGVPICDELERRGARVVTADLPGSGADLEADLSDPAGPAKLAEDAGAIDVLVNNAGVCLLYTSPSPRDATLSRMPSSA